MFDEERDEDERQQTGGARDLAVGKPALTKGAERRQVHGEQRERQDQMQKVHAAGGAESTVRRCAEA
ncbi:MAG: hypothetical protein N2688_13085 [Burkholderiaceae bacterium]|nr:hypothetical protein [Burkholderiaceae bacterium]